MGVHGHPSSSELKTSSSISLSEAFLFFASGSWFAWAAADPQAIFKSEGDLEREEARLRSAGGGGDPKHQTEIDGKLRDVFINR